MWIETADRALRQIPFFSNYYEKNTARLKRETCLLLNRLGLLKPFSFVQWLATYRCNFQCPFCESSTDKAGENELTTREVMGLMDDLAKMRVRRLIISGGEPLVRGDLMELMHYGRKNNIRFGLVTNGYLVEKLWDSLKQFTYFLYFTSIDGLAEYHDSIRRKHSFQAAMRGLELFGSLGVPNIMVNTVVHPQNIDQLDELLNIIKESPSTLWRLAPLAQKGKAVGQDQWLLDGHQLKYLVEFIENKKNIISMDLAESHSYIGCFRDHPVGKPFFCGAGLTRCSVTPDGYVLGCHDVYDNSLAEGNIHDKAFSRIWKEEFSRFRQDRRIHDTCKSCGYFNACQGGCWAEMEKQSDCMKSVWEQPY